MNDLLVTGATGNVGAALVRLLDEAGLPCRLAGRHPERLRAAAGSGMDCVRLDFRQPQTFDAALRGMRRVFLVRPPDVSNVRRDMKPFIDAMRSAGVQHVVFLSIANAERAAFVPHRRIEQELVRSGMRWTFLRAGFFMQNLSTVHRDEILRTGEIALPAGRGRTAFIDVRDIAEVAMQMLRDGSGGETPVLTGNETLNYFEAADLLTEALGRPIRYRPISIPRFLIRQVRRGVPLPMAFVMAAIYTTTRLGLAAQVTNDVTQILGRPPRTLRSFAEDGAFGFVRARSAESASKTEIELQRNRRILNNVSREPR